MLPLRKNVWDNCARIISERSDNELKSYLTDMMEWLQDMNWPGAFCILDRLKKYEDRVWLMKEYTKFMKCAKALEDESWENNLKEIFG